VARVHRHHRAAEDTPDDPPSPQHFGGGRRGGGYVLLNNPLYRHATRSHRLAHKYRDLAADRWNREGRLRLAAIKILCALRLARITGRGTRGRQRLDAFCATETIDTHEHEPPGAVVRVGDVDPSACRAVASHATC
jgi:hypothetical protein